MQYEADIMAGTLSVPVVMPRLLLSRVDGAV